jgi:hypothetical protein
MKTLIHTPVASTLKASLHLTARRRVFALGMFLALALTVRAADMAKTFATPEEAVSELAAAARSNNTAALHTIFGPAGTDLENPDRVQSTNDLAKFTVAYNEAHRVVRESEDEYVLVVGPDEWPFPVPIVKRAGRWFFDTEEGKDELLRRRIGKNELYTLDVMRAYVDAQREYASKDRDGDQVLEYAQRITSSPGQTDGLYWPPELNGEASPLGPLFAEAQNQGYIVKPAVTQAGPRPFHGYFFRILMEQGSHAPGGKYNYIINGNMIGGFALIAWPADYGDSGIMTFIVNQQGRVYQKDLGEKTAKIVKKMHAYDPDSSWQPSQD